MKPKPDTQEKADRWNSIWPVGTPVTQYELMHPRRNPLKKTKTTSTAWLMCGTAVVKLENVSGCIAIDALEVNK